MSDKFKGTVTHVKMGPGAWALQTSDGQQYQLLKPPADLKKEGLEVEIKGKIRDDVATAAMIGPVLEVESFKAQ
ncbi:hypothetical protein [Leptolyngbya sp. FACHB-261]|uniref:hypothetical protein n=1 Tax=Leptolyngbya sp. FACHB-261 TaxID=2692806 RepID=UPI0016862061|nr:hypothetical protein [Leptolyngbya sp. FACHB-261]MBD2105144.1 hypothetical protein [Leptolyngbya sp. FACHB-261]